MKRLLSCSLLTILLAAVGGAQSKKVTYLEGEVQAKGGGAWTSLAVGDTLPADGTVRVGSGGLAQFQVNDLVVTISRAGTYLVRDLVTARRKAAVGLGATFANAFRLLVTGSAPNQSTAAGRRGADESKSSRAQWSDSPADVYLSAGIDSITSGKSPEAVQQLDLALAVADGSEADEIHFYRGCALSLGGDTLGGWREIAGLQPPSSAPWVSDFVLLKAQLLESTSAYAEATELLVAHDMSRDAQRAQLYFYLLGIGYQAAGRLDGARAALSRARDVEPMSDVGKASGELLKGM